MLFNGFTFQDQQLKEIAIRAVKSTGNAPFFIVVLLQQRVPAAVGPYAAGQAVVLGLGRGFSLGLFGLFREGSLGCSRAVLFDRTTFDSRTGRRGCCGLGF